MLRPFKPAVANKDEYLSIIAPPYDVLSLQQAMSYGQDNPHNIVHLTRPEIDCDESTASDDIACYEKAKQNLTQFLNDNTFNLQQQDAFFIYQISKEEWLQTGLVAMLELDDKNRHQLKKHEHTRPKKVADRAALIKHLDAQISPVLLTYKRHQSLQQKLETLCTTPATYAAQDEQGFHHQLWHIHNPDEVSAIEALIASIDEIYIADGHHRCEAAAHAQPNDSKILSVVFPSDELRILGYHRLIKDLNGLDASGIIEAIAEHFTIEKANSAVLPNQKGVFGMYLANQWYQINSNDNQTLDVTILHQQIIEPLFAISNPREDKRIDFIGGEEATQQMKEKCDAGEFAIAFTLNPTAMDEVIDVADQQAVMPPKSTWFEPKLLDGFLLSLGLCK